MSVSASLTLVAIASVVAFGLRSSFILLLGDVEVPPWIERTLSFIGPAVLAAMTVNFAFGGEGGPHLTVPTVLTMLVALGLSIWKRNLLLTLAISMTVLWTTTALLG